MRWRPTARARLTTLWVVGLLCYQVLAPLPTLAAPTPPDAPSPEATKPPGIDELGYDPDWVSPAEPAPISIPDEPGGASSISDPSIGQRAAQFADEPPLVPTELPERRTEQTRTIANPDGTFTLEVSQGRLNYRDGFGDWQPMDLSLVADRTGPYSLRVAANDATVRFGSGDAESGLGQLSANGHTIGLRAIGYAAGSRVDNVVSFSGASNAGTVAIQPTDLGFEFSVTLDNPAQASVYHFALDTGDLIPVLGIDGKTIMLLAPNASGFLASDVAVAGDIAGVISAPFMLESDRTRFDGTPVSVELTVPGTTGLPSDIPTTAIADLSAKEVLITYRIDPGWLADTARQFPVVLDPTACIGVGHAGCSGGNDDEFIFSQNPNAYADGWTVVRAGYDVTTTDGGVYAATRGLFYFPDVSLGDGAVVTAADLAVTINASYGSVVGKSYYAYRINKPWGTNSVTWNTLIPNGFDTSPASPGVTVPSSPSGKVLTFDLRDTVRSWYTRRPADWRADEGVMIKSGVASHAEVSGDGELYIYKYTSTSCVPCRPKLTITYELPKVQIDFDPALGNTYAPSGMVAGQVTRLPIKMLNNNSGFSFDTTNWKVGWRWFDATGTLVTCPGTCTSSLPASIASGSWSTLFNISVTAPTNPGQYTLRLDLLRVVSGVNLWASDWARPSLYYSRDKKILTSDNTRWTGSSAIERDDFGISVHRGGGMNGGVSEAVGGLSINLNSGNLRYAGDTGLGFGDLVSPTLSYGYDKVNTSECGGILDACGWYTNWDERFSQTADYTYTYQTATGDQFLATTDANAQLTSGAPALIARPRVTWFDEVDPTSASVNAVLAASEGIPAYSGSIVTRQVSQSSISYGTVTKVDLLRYRYVSFEARTTLATGVGIDFKIHNASNPTGYPDRWFIYTVGTDFSVGSFDKIALGGSVVNAWAGANRRNLYSDLISEGTFGVEGDRLEVFAFQTTTNGQSGYTYLDSVRFEGSWSGILNDDNPTWYSGGTYASANTSDKVEGSQSMQVSPTSVANSPLCDTVCRWVNHLDQWPYVRWNWKKVGGSTVATAFRLKDVRTGTTGWITYYAGPVAPPGATNPIQVSPVLPTSWTRVERNLIEDGRQVLNFYYDDPGSSDPNAPPTQGPTPDAVDFDAYQLIAYDGSFALFDDIDFFTLPDYGSDELGEPNSVGDTTFLYDFIATYADGSQHYFNPDGLLIRIKDRDANKLELVWSYELAGGGQSAYTLTTIRAPGDGMSLSSGTAQREIAVTSTTPSGFRQITFTEQLGSTTSATGRRADFHVATSTGTTWGVSDLVKVSPARNNSATCGTRPNGCVEIAYTSTSSHFIDLVADPRWDGSTSGGNDMRLDVTYDGSNRAYQILDRSNTSAARLFVETFDDPTVSIGYRRVLFQNAANRAANYATYLDLSPDGQPMIRYGPKACSGTCSATNSTWPADPTASDKLSESLFDGLARVNQTTSYRVSGASPQKEVTRQGSNAAAKVENFVDAREVNQPAWTQTADQYFASVADSGGTNPDLYRTQYAYNALGLPIVLSNPVANAHPDYPGVVKANNAPTAYWRLGETSGTTAADSSGNGNTATISATGVTLNQPDALSNDANAAMLLNGSTGRLTSAVSLPQTAYTLEAWVSQQTAYTTGGRGIVGDWASTGALLYLSSGKLTMVHGSTYLITAVTLDTGRWYHLAGTWDGAVMRIYVDGELVANKAVTAAPGTGATAFEIGSYANGSGTTFNNARIDEVGLWSSALPPQRVLNHYLAGRSIALPTQRTTYDSEGHPTEAATHFAINGGFENGLAEWDVNGAATISTTTKKSGFVGLQLATAAYVRQDAQLVPGQTLRFQLAAKADSGAQADFDAAYWQVSSQSWVSLVLASHASSTWTTYAYDLTLPLDSDGRVRVLLASGGASSNAYFDDILLVTNWSRATYSSIGLLTDTYSLQSGSTSGATLRTKTTYNADGDHPAVFPTDIAANYVNGIYNDAYRDEDLITGRDFDRWGRVLAVTDPDGVTNSSAYASNLTDVASTADGLGQTTAFTYDKVGHRLSMTSPAGLLTATTYNFLGNPLTITGPDGVVSLNSYNSYGQRTASFANYVNGTPSGASGTDDVKTTYTYDAFGRQLSSVADTGYTGSPDVTTTLTYDLLGNVLTSAESGSGVSARTTTNYFETFGSSPIYSRSEPTGVRLPIAPSASPAPLCPGSASTRCNTLTTLDLNGRAIKVTDTYGKATVTDYDLAGRAVRTIANYGDGVYSGSNPDTDVVSSAIYDIAGRPVSTTTCGVTCSGGDLRITKTSYDDVDRPIQQTAQMPAGTDYSFTKIVYLPSGRVERSSAPAAVGTGDSSLTWTKTEYDAAGRAVRTLAHYDSIGNAHYRLDAFEDRDTSGWSSAASGYFTVSAAGSMGLDNDFHTTAPKSGAGRLRMSTHATSGYNGMWWDLSGQTFQAGRTYHLHADLVAWSGNTLRAFFGVDASGASYGSSPAISTTGSWQTIDIDWTPTTSVSSNVHFALRKDTAGTINAYLDNVQVWDTTQPDWNILSETGYDADGQPIASVLPPGHVGEAPMVTTTAYDPAGRPTLVSVNARTLYSHQIMADGLSNGLIAYYPLDEHSGMTAVDVKTALNATYAGGYHLGLAGGVDDSRTAASMDGATGVASRGANVTSVTDNFSLEAWFRRDAAGSNQVIVHNGTAITGWGLGLDSFGYLSARYEATGWLSTGVSPSVGVWHHAVVVRNSGTTTIYLDGTSYTPSSSTSAPSTPGAGFSIGRQAASTRLFAGAVDEVAIYTAALSSGAVAAHYAAGRDTTADGRLTTRSDYDALGRPTTETSPRGIRTASIYDRLGRTTSTTANYVDGTPAGAATDDDLTATFAYNALGELIGSCSPRQVFASGCAPGTPSNAQAWHYTYDAMGHQVTQVPPVNQTLTALASRSWVYDAGGRLSTVCDHAAGGSCASASRHTDTTYDGVGRVLTSEVYAGAGTDPGTLRLSWTSTWNPDGSQASLAFDGEGSAQGTDTLTFTYDGLGRPDQVKRSSTVLTDNGWNAAGNLASRIDGTSGSSSFSYDWASRLTSATSPVYAGSQTFAWRLDGLMDSRQWPSGSGGAGTFSYDLAKRPTAFAKAGSAASSFVQTYDRDGNVTSEDRSLSGVSGLAGVGNQVFSYDGANRVSAATLGTPPTPDSSAPTTPTALGATAIAADRIDLSWTASTDDVAVVRYRIHRDGVQISEVAAGTTTFSDRSTVPSTAYSYTVDALDAAGNASSQSTAANATTPAGGSYTVTDPPSSNDAGWTNSANAYASDDAYATAAPAKNQTATLNLGTFGIDAAVPAGATITNVTVSVEWKVDATNSIATLGSQLYVSGVAQGSELVNTAEPTSDTVQTYSLSGLTRADLLDGVLTIRNRISRGNDPQAVTASIDAVGVQVDYSAPPPTDSTAPSVPAGLTATAAGSSRVNLSWSASTDNVAVQGYGIYRDGGLIATTASTSYADTAVAGSTAYSYTVAAIDGSANASAQSSSAGATTSAPSGIAYAYAYDRDANRTSATIGAATTTYAFDRTSELISRTDAGLTTYLAYDAFGNQTSSAPAVNLNTASTYDLADRLTSITPPGQSATTFSFDALGRHLTRVTPAGTDAYEYLATSETVWRITAAGISTTSALDPSGARLASAQGGTTGYLLPDLHGNLAAVVNAAETAILAATRYDAFGQTAAAYDSGGSFPTPWRFQGRLDVSPDGNPLYDFSARYYDPGIGAFTQLDTYAGAPGDPLSLNRYAYAAANPWTLIDPDGHAALACPSDGCGGGSLPSSGIPQSTPTPTPPRTPTPGPRTAPFVAGQTSSQDVNWWEAATHFVQSAGTAAIVGIGAAIICVGTVVIGCVVVGGVALGYGAYSSYQTFSDPKVSAQDKVNLAADWGGGVLGGAGGIRIGVGGGPRLVPGSNNALRNPLTGRFATNPGSASSISRATRTVGSSSHGNSYLSARLTTLYEVIEISTGKRLKWGITSEANIQSRYTKAELEGTFMRPVTQGSRADMAALERWLVQRAPGPQNYERWAGTIEESIGIWQ